MSYYITQMSKERSEEHSENILTFRKRSQEHL